MTKKQCDCALAGEGCCSECYAGPAIDLPPLSDEERYKAHVEMERQAHEEDAK